jgi:hypothetical protein
MQVALLAALCSSALFAACLMSYWRMRKRGLTCKCQSCIPCEKDGGQSENVRPDPVAEMWRWDGITLGADGFFGDGWDEPALEEMPEDTSGVSDVDAMMVGLPELSVAGTVPDFRVKSLAGDIFPAASSSESDRNKDGDSDLNMERDAPATDAEALTFEI